MPTSTAVRPASRLLVPRSRSPLGSQSRPSDVLVLTADPVLARHLLSVVAAVGLGAQEASGDDVRRAWRDAVAVLVGVDRAAEVRELALPSRSEVYVVGRDDGRAETSAWSTRLRAAVATVPSGAADLADALAALVGGGGQGGLVAVTGGSGGVGASTLAAALAVVSARAGMRTFLMDADLTGGGIDVLLGAEHLAGWRWSRLRSARGHVPDLGGQLPHCDGVDLLAMDRRQSEDEPLRADQVAAVLDSAGRTHDQVVVDLGRSDRPAHDEVLRRAGTVLLVVRADVRGVAAADAIARGLVPRCREVEVVVRTGRGHGLAPDLVADTLDLPLAGELEDDPALLHAAERGDPPGQHARSAVARLCEELLRQQREVAA